MSRPLSIVAVTACVSGVAHTYMAAERLRELARKEGHKIAVETQGALGVESPLEPAQISDADLVVICADVGIDNAERFDGHRVVRCSISKALKTPDALRAAIVRAAVAPKGVTIVV